MLASRSEPAEGAWIDSIEPAVDPSAVRGRTPLVVPTQEPAAMTARSLNEAIFRLGQISADRHLTNATLLKHLADVAVDTLGVDAAVLAVFERGIEGQPSTICVRGPWRELERDRFLEQSRWQFDARAMAHRLSVLRRGRLFHRPDLLSGRDSIGLDEVPASVGVADQAVALYRRNDAIEMLFAIHRVEGTGPFSRATLARAGALAPFLAQCWAGSWSTEPEWMRALKPVSRAILEQLLQGYDDDQIADRTRLSYHSVRAHLKRLFREAGVRSRLHLMQACRPIAAAGLDFTVEIPTDESAHQATG